MKLFSFILLLAALIQTSFLPIDLTLIILICRSYAVHKKENYYLALIAGILMGILTPVNLGFWPLVSVGIVLLVHLVRLLPVTNKSLMIVPVSIGILTLAGLGESLMLETHFVWWYGVIGGLIALPIYIGVKTWEDRFIVKTGIKLRV